MQSLHYRFYNLLTYLFDTVIAFDCDDTQRLPCSNLVVFGVDAREEGIFFALETAFVDLGIAGVATACAGEGSVKIRQQKDGQIRLQIAADKSMQIENDFGAKLAATALIGLGGIGEAIAEDELTGSKSWFDDLLDRLCAIGEHHGQFCVRREICGFRIEEQCSDAVAEGCAAGLTGFDDGVAFLFERLFEEPDLRGFA